MDRNYDLIVIGGGIVGMATAYEALIRRPQLRLLVLEKEPTVAAHQSGHNSGVIHSGIYYKPGSLKARTCVAGARAMFDFCREHDIPRAVCGKLILATSEQELAPLEELYQRGLENGINVEIRSGHELHAVEPFAAGVRALYVPGTGITDYSAVTRKLAELITRRTGDVRTGARVTDLTTSGSTVIANTTLGEFRATRLVNCAGLYADHLARLAGTNPGLQIVPFRGEYYELSPQKRGLIKGLIYPVPDPKFPFLGVHFTLRVDGSMEAGPNAVMAFAREGYTKWQFAPGELWETIRYAGFRRMAFRYWRSGFSEWKRSMSKRSFTRSLQKLVPAIRESDLRPGGSGVRAQAVTPEGRLLDDFHIVQDRQMVHVLNVPSPAATASLSIARHICDSFE